VKVFKGLNESTGELFAVKQISLTRGLKEEINTLQTEIDLMKDLDHRYHEYFDTFPQSRMEVRAPPRAIP